MAILPILSISLFFFFTRLHIHIELKIKVNKNKAKTTNKSKYRYECGRESLGALNNLFTVRTYAQVESNVEIILIS